MLKPGGRFHLFGIGLPSADADLPSIEEWIKAIETMPETSSAPMAGLGKASAGGVAFKSIPPKTGRDSKRPTCAQRIKQGESGKPGDRDYSTPAKGEDCLPRRLSAGQVAMAGQSLPAKPDDKPA